MDIRVNNDIIAIVVRRENISKVGGGAPIFIAETEEELEEIGMLLARITRGMVHDLKNGIHILVRH